MTGFTHDVAGGNGELIAVSVQSPNFVAGVSGWQIARNGDAEFNSITLPDGQGVSVFFAGTAPSTTHVGDLWYDTSDGLALSRWSGTAWVPYQIGTGAIAAGAVDGSLLASTVTARSLGGITTTISSTAPASPAAGDLWISSAAGYQLSQYSGTAWVPLSWTATDVLSAATITGSLIAASTITGGNIAAGTITASNIAANTITASQLAAGIVYAGIVNSTTVNAATFTGSTFEGTDFVIDTSGAFFYSGTPGAGNLVASTAAAAGTDPYGNKYAAGVNAYATAGTVTYAIGLDKISADGLPGFSVGDVATPAQSPAGVFAESSGAPGSQVAKAALASGVAVTGDTEASVQVESAQTSGTTNGSAVISAGVTTIGALSGTLQVNDLNGGLYLPNPQASAPVVAGGSAGLYSDGNATPGAFTGAGLAGTIAVTQTDTGSYANANSATQVLCKTWAIPANDAHAGTVYEIEVPFNGTFETATLGFKPRIGGDSAATTSGGDTIGGGFFTAGTAFAGSLRLRMVVTTTGSSGLCDFFIDGGIGNNGNRSSGTNNNNAYLSSQATGQAFNTTVSNTITIVSVWGSSVAGQTVSGTGSTFTRKGP